MINESLFVTANSMPSPINQRQVIAETKQYCTLDAVDDAVLSSQMAAVTIEWVSLVGPMKYSLTASTSFHYRVISVFNVFTNRPRRNGKLQ